MLPANSYHNPSMENAKVGEILLRCSLFFDILKDLGETWIDYFFIVVNLILSGSAILGNLLILVALKKDSRLHLPSKLLIRSLASTDLCVGLIAQPSFVVYLILILKKKFGLCETSESVANLSCVVFTVISLCTLTWISVDRFLALQLGMRYRHFVTVARVRRIVVFSWLLVLATGTFQFWKHNFFLVILTFIVIICLILTIFCYTMIFVTMRRRRARQIAEIGQQTGHMLRYKKTVYKLLWISLLMVSFYVPFSYVTAVRLIKGPDATNAVWLVSMATVVFLNSSLNPFVYIWKIREVRRAVILTLRNLFSSCFQQ